MSGGISLPKNYMRNFLLYWLAVYWWTAIATITTGQTYDGWQFTDRLPLLLSDWVIDLDVTLYIQYPPPSAEWWTTCRGGLGLHSPYMYLYIILLHDPRGCIWKVVGGSLFPLPLAECQTIYTDTHSTAHVAECQTVYTNLFSPIARPHLGWVLDYLHRSLTNMLKIILFYSFIVHKAIAIENNLLCVSYFSYEL